jgi:hypothetical protein
MLLGVAEYAVFLATFDAVHMQVGFVAVAVWNLLALAAFIITIVDSVRKVRARKSSRLATDAMVAKLASAPFFLVSAVVLPLALLGGTLTLLFGGGVVWIVVPIVAVLTYFVMLSTSVYGWAAIVQLRRERALGIPLTVVYAILLFVPLADIVVSILLFGRRRPLAALAVAMFIVGLLVVFFGLFGFFGLTNDVEGGLDPGGVVSLIVTAIGFGLILATAIVAVVRRSNLRAEAQQAGAVAT